MQYPTHLFSSYFYWALDTFQFSLVLFFRAMERMTVSQRHALIHSIAKREGTARELAQWYGTTPEELRDFVEANRPAIQAEAQRLEEPPPAADLSPTDLDGLWITKKFERLKRLQEVADDSYNQLTDSAGMLPAEYATAMREFRSYLMLAANELGQLLHRGSGDSGTGDTLSVDIQGIDMENLR